MNTSKIPTGPAKSSRSPQKHTGPTNSSIDYNRPLPPAPPSPSVPPPPPPQTPSSVKKNKLPPPGQSSPLLSAFNKRRESRSLSTNSPTFTSPPWGGNESSHQERPRSQSRPQQHSQNVPLPPLPPLSSLYDQISSPKGPSKAMSILGEGPQASKPAQGQATREHTASDSRSVPPLTDAVMLGLDHGSRAMGKQPTAGSNIIIPQQQRRDSETEKLKGLSADTPNSRETAPATVHGNNDNDHQIHINSDTFLGVPVINSSIEPLELPVFTPRDDDDDEFPMMSTSSPGQEWRPPLFGWNTPLSF